MEKKLLNNSCENVERALSPEDVSRVKKITSEAVHLMENLLKECEKEQKPSGTMVQLLEKAIEQYMTYKKEIASLINKINATDSFKDDEDWNDLDILNKAVTAGIEKCTELLAQYRGDSAAFHTEADMEELSEGEPVFALTVDEKNLMMVLASDTFFQKLTEGIEEIPLENLNVRINVCNKYKEKVDALIDRINTEAPQTDEIKTMWRTLCALNKEILLTRTTLQMCADRR